jgi:hypothetical protein
MRTIHVLAALAIAAPVAPARARSADDAALVRHVPPAEVTVGERLLVEAQVERGWKLDALDLHWRRAGGTWNTTAFGKTASAGWAAVVAAAEVVPPVIEYFITSRAPGGPAVDRFASADAPHPVLVSPPDDDLERQERLLGYRGHRSRARAVGEWVSFGGHGRDATGVGYRDAYYRTEAEYLYRILTFVESIQLGMVHFRGDVPPPSAFRTGTSTEPARATGMDYGYAEIALALSEVIGVKGRLLLGADDLGFAMGAGASLRLGEPTRAHLEIGAETIRRVGSDGFVRFAWDTVPRWPMSLALHVTNQPAAPLRPAVSPAQPDDLRIDEGAPTGVRAVWQIGYELTRAITLSVRAGYQARVSTAGGPTLGAGLDVEW